MNNRFVRLEPRILFAGGIPDLPFGVNAEALLEIPEPHARVEYSTILRKDNGDFLIIGSTVGDPGNNPDATFIFTVSPGGDVDKSLATGDLPYTLPRDARILDDGKILIAGRNMLRLNADGTPDTTFGGGDGVVKTEAPGFDGTSAYRILDDGSVISATSTGITKYTSAGAVDSAFASNGRLDWQSISPLSSYGSCVIAGMELDATGRIVVGLVAKTISSDHDGDVFVLRLSANGTPDTSFSGDGVASNGSLGATSLTARAADLAILSTGRIVMMAGETSSAIENGPVPTVYLYAFTNTGLVDSGVVGDNSDGGKVSVPGLLPYGTLTPLSNGDFILTAQDTTVNGVALYKLNSDFSFDTGFSADGDGKVVLGNTRLDSIWADDTGLILAAGPRSVTKFHDDASADERVILDNKVIRIEGTAVADNILVQKFDQEVRVRFGEDEWNFTASDVNRVEIRAGGGADRIQKSAPIASLIYGDNGDDGIWTRSGKDTIFGGRGSDMLDGGPGRDNINGDAGDDLIYGGVGNDLLKGGGGNDTLRGEDGDDLLLGNAGKDTLFGHTGNDTLFGGDDHDYLVAVNEGQDQVNGEAGRDRASVDVSDEVLGVEEIVV